MHTYSTNLMIMKRTIFSHLNIIEHKKDISPWKPGPGFRQANKSGWIKPVDCIPTLPL